MSIPIFRKCGFNRIKSMLMAFLKEKGKWALKICEISPISRFWIFTAQTILKSKKALRGQNFWFITVKIFISSWLGEMNSYTITSNTTKKAVIVIALACELQSQHKVSRLPNVSFNCLLFVGRYYQTIRKKARAYKSITNVLVVDFFSFHSTEVPRCVTTFKSNIHAYTV